MHNHSRPRTCKLPDSKPCQGSGNAGIPQASDSSTHFFRAVPSSLCLGCWELSYTAYEKVLSAAHLLEGWAKNEKPIVIDLEAHEPTELYSGKRDQPF